jgi:hypothetical protein
LLRPKFCRKPDLNTKTSVFDYLLAVNWLGNRSLIDLSAYPLFPRLVKSFIPALPLRELPLPIDIANDPEGLITGLNATRFTTQHYHHPECPSQPLGVAVLLSRLMPYTRFQWEVNDGWDAGNRFFVALAGSLEISTRTSSELPPEFFALPEVLVNVNGLKLPDGRDYDVQFPAWLPNAELFTELQRRLLEGEKVRGSLHQWIDLLFGVALKGETGASRMNVYHAMAYVGKNPKEFQGKWIQSCGQVPAQVFTRAHPEMAKVDTREITVGRVAFKPESAIAGRKFPIGDTVVPLIRHAALSASKQFLVLTTFASIVKVIRLGDPDVDQAMVFLQTPVFSVLLEEQMVCYTVCLGEVVIWSFATGHILRRMEVAHVGCLTVNAERNALFLARGTELAEYSVNGRLVRSIDIAEGCKKLEGKKVTAIGTFGRSFWRHGESVIVGTRNGNVIRLKVNDSGGFEKVWTERMSFSKIHSIVTDDDTCKVVVS